MTYQLIRLSPLERITAPLDGFPPRRSIGDPSEWSAPEGCRYVPIMDVPSHDSETQRPVQHLTETGDTWTLELVAAERSAQRTALRQQWDALPDFIRGPFRDKFEAANRLLDEGDDDAAIALIKYAEAPASFTADQIATFAATQAAMKAGIENLTQAP